MGDAPRLTMEMLQQCMQAALAGGVGCAVACRRVPSVELTPEQQQALIDDPRNGSAVETAVCLAHPAQTPLSEIVGVCYGSLDAVMDLTRQLCEANGLDADNVQAELINRLSVNRLKPGTFTQLQESWQRLVQGPTVEAPACPICGTITVRVGAGWKCLNCGFSSDVN